MKLKMLSKYATEFSEQDDYAESTNRRMKNKFESLAKTASQSEPLKAPIAESLPLLTALENASKPSSQAAVEAKNSIRVVIKLVLHQHSSGEIQASLKAVKPYLENAFNMVGRWYNHLLDHLVKFYHKLTIGDPEWLLSAKLESRTGELVHCDGASAEVRSYISEVNSILAEAVVAQSKAEVLRPLTLLRSLDPGTQYLLGIKDDVQFGLGKFNIMEEYIQYASRLLSETWQMAGDRRTSTVIPKLLALKANLDSIGPCPQTLRAAHQAWMSALKVKDVATQDYKDSLVSLRSSVRVVLLAVTCNKMAAEYDAAALLSLWETSNSYLQWSDSEHRDGEALGLITHAACLYMWLCQ
jgi:hypothetical protein